MTSATVSPEVAALLPSSADQKLDIAFGGYSCAGVKPVNEDAFAVRAPKGIALQMKGIAACIADGASCSAQAQLASETAVTHFLSDYYSTPDTWPVKSAGARVLSALNSWLYHHGKQSILPHNGLVTTFSGVIVKSTSAHIFHSGDSRIYRYRDGKLIALTRDHSHYQRDGVAFLTRALGMDSHLEVDYSVEEIESGDILLLSTDGVHGTLTNAELAAHLVAPIENLEHRAKQIVDDALRKGSDDNLSCLLLRVDNLPLADIDEVHRQLTQLAIPPALEPGQRIDGLRVQRVIHNGTRSHLYLVQDEASGTHYVLKAPSPNFADDAQYLEGFIREQWVASRVQHAGVMKIFPRPEHSPFLYLLCEYIEGQTLRQWLFDNPNAPLETVRNIVRDIISALRALQRTHMTHRDLKPENIMLTGTGHIKLIDFGTVHIGGFDDVASPLNDEVPVGSVDYIAPEYLLGENGAFASDIFSLGVIVYEMLTGVLPYKLSANRQRNLRHLREYQYIPARERRRDIPQWLDLALQKATHPDARLRYQALSEFMHDLCTPNQDLVRTHQHAPLIQRNPIRFWQGTTLILLIAVIAQCSQLVGK